MSKVPVVVPAATTAVGYTNVACALELASLIVAPPAGAGLARVTVPRISPAPPTVVPVTSTRLESRLDVLGVSVSGRLRSLPPYFAATTPVPTLGIFAVLMTNLAVVRPARTFTVVG